MLQEPALPLSPCAAWVARSQVAVKEVYEQYPTRAFVEKIAGEAAAARNVVHRFLAACYGLSMQVPPAVSREGAVHAGAACGVERGAWREAQSAAELRRRSRGCSRPYGCRESSWLRFSPEGSSKIRHF